MSSGLIPEFALLVTNLYAPPGTSIPMAQAAAPLGWTSSVVSDTAFRYNSGTGGGTGGSTAWSSWSGGGTFNVNSFTLSIAQLPAHNHTDSGHTHTDAGHVHTASGGAAFYTNAVSQLLTGGGTNSFTIALDTATGFASINTGNANIQNTGSGSSIQPNFTTPTVKYVDHILAVKS